MRESVSLQYDKEYYGERAGGSRHIVVGQAGTKLFVDSSVFGDHYLQEMAYNAMGVKERKLSAGIDERRNAGTHEFSTPSELSNKRPAVGDP